MNPKQHNPIWNLNFTGDTLGFPLVWLHGFMGSSRDWLPLVDEHFRDYCNILVDLPGHGESKLPDQVEYPALLSDLFRQLSTAGFRTFIPIGYSMGGRMALHLQQRYPCHIPALVGLSTAPGLKTDHERQDRQQSDSKLMDKLDQQGLKLFLKEWYQNPLFQSIHSNKQLLSTLLASRRNNDPAQLRLAIKRLGNGVMPSLWEALSKIDLPMLLVSGSEDQKYCNINTEMATKLPKAEQHVINNADHAFHLEKPLDTALLIRHFLRQVI